MDGDHTMKLMSMAITQKFQQPHFKVQETQQLQTDSQYVKLKKTLPLATLAPKFICLARPASQHMTDTPILAAMAFVLRLADLLERQMVLALCLHSSEFHNFAECHKVASKQSSDLTCHGCLHQQQGSHAEEGSRTEQR